MKFPNIISNFFLSILQNDNNRKDILKILICFFIASAFLYGYFHFFHPLKMQLVYQNWDGPSYVVIAKSFYNQELITQVNTLGLPTGYFAAHPPLYPLLIRLFSFMGYFRSMIFVSWLSAALYLCLFYIFIQDYLPTEKAFILTLLSIFLSPRWFVVSHTGSSEPLFLLLLCLFLILLKKQKTTWLILVAILLQLTRIQAILVFIGASSYYVFKWLKREMSPKTTAQRIIPLLVMPVSLLALFVFYHFQIGNFFAFFDAQKMVNASSHLQFPPYRVLLIHHYLPSAIESWREIFVFYYVLIALTVIKLFQEKRSMLSFIALALAAPLVFLVHIDLARYSIPLMPFFFLAFRRELTKKSFLLAYFISLPAIYAYAINIMLYNLTP